MARLEGRTALQTPGAIEAGRREFEVAVGERSHCALNQTRHIRCEAPRAGVEPLLHHTGTVGEAEQQSELVGQRGQQVKGAGSRTLGGPAFARRDRGVELQRTDGARVDIPPPTARVPVDSDQPLARVEVTQRQDVAWEVGDLEANGGQRICHGKVVACRQPLCNSLPCDGGEIGVERKHLAHRCRWWCAHRCALER